MFSEEENLLGPTRAGGLGLVTAIIFLSGEMAGSGVLALPKALVGTGGFWCISQLNLKFFKAVQFDLPKEPESVLFYYSNAGTSLLYTQAIGQIVHLTNFLLMDTYHQFHHSQAGRAFSWSSSSRSTGPTSDLASDSAGKFWPRSMTSSTSPTFETRTHWSRKRQDLPRDPRLPRFSEGWPLVRFLMVAILE